MTRILIADDHYIVRKGLKEILKEEFPFAKITEVADAESMVRETIKNEWDIVISDISMPGRSGLDALLQIKETAPKLPVLILSVYPEDQYAVRVLKAGAAGYLNKDMAPEELVSAVRIILSGKKYITPSIAEKLLSSISSGEEKKLHEVLSDREFEVFKLLASGKTVSEIAERLSISSTTASTYRSRILTKMNLKTNAEIVRYAIEHSLI